MSQELQVATHRSSTNPDARLARKSLGQTSHLAYHAHLLLDNRHGLVREVCVTQATGTAEVDAATLLLIATAVPPQSTVGADKDYDQRRVVHALRARRITPYVAAKRRRSALDVSSPKT